MLQVSQRHGVHSGRGWEVHRDTSLTLLHAGVKSVKWKDPLVCCQSVVLQQVCSLQTQHYDSGIKLKKTTNYWLLGNDSSCYSFYFLACVITWSYIRQWTSARNSMQDELTLFFFSCCGFGIANVCSFVCLIVQIIVCSFKLGRCEISKI